MHYMPVYHWKPSLDIVYWFDYIQIADWCCFTPEVAAEHVEGGLYISPEFQLGQVYDGTMDHEEDIILYRPVYVCVPHDKINVTNMNNATGAAGSHGPPRAIASTSAPGRDGYVTVKNKDGDSPKASSGPVQQEATSI